MFRHLIVSLRIFITLTILTCVIYPLVVTGIARWAFPEQAQGSLIQQDGKILGSALLAQSFTEDRYFWPRPSAADYATVASGASNQGFTSKKLIEQINSRRQAPGSVDSPDMLTASASGLDPHISPAAAQAQVGRVASARGLPPAMVEALVRQYTELPQFGFLGQPRVNVLLLNLALDASAKVSSAKSSPPHPGFSLQ